MKRFILVALVAMLLFAVVPALSVGENAEFCMEQERGNGVGARCTTNCGGSNGDNWIIRCTVRHNWERGYHCTCWWCNKNEAPEGCGAAKPCPI